jgi:hypothetical protein
MIDYRSRVKEEIMGLFSTPKKRKTGTGGEKGRGRDTGTAERITGMDLIGAPLPDGQRGGGKK